MRTCSRKTPTKLPGALNEVKSLGARVTKKTTRTDEVEITPLGNGNKNDTTFDTMQITALKLIDIAKFSTVMVPVFFSTPMYIKNRIESERDGDEEETMSVRISGMGWRRLPSL